jgi:hypothetical protein
MKFYTGRCHALALTFATGLACSLVPVQARAQLYTTYNFSGAGFSWITCGSTSLSEGCYGSGTVTGFGRLCAILSDTIVGSSTSSLQRIYALDSEGNGKRDVVLHYLTRRISVDSSGYAYTTFTDVKDVRLPLEGGPHVACYAADNDSVIAAGTSTSTTAAVLVKPSLKVSSYGGFSPPATMTGIAADAAGNIALNFSGGFYLLGPNGGGLEDGGGNAFVIPLHNAYIP